jgi:hypothetical protein
MSTSRSSRALRGTALATFALLLTALVAAPLASAGGPTWLTIRKITDGGRPGAGAALSTTRSSTTRYLHATWRKGAGQVQFARSTNGGSTWTSPLTIANPEFMLGEPRIASVSNDVWIAWVRRYEDPDTGSYGYAVLVRHNGSHGSASGWGTTRRLTAMDGNVRGANIAVTDGGASIYVTYSDLRSDETRLKYSHNGGSSWSTVILGEGFDEDFEGVPTTLPVVGASGRNVVAAWVAPGNVATARVSTDRGLHWSAPTVVGDGLSTAAANGSRLAVGGTGEIGPWIRVWNAGTWGVVREIPEITLGGNNASAVELDIRVNTNGRIGAVYSAQVDVDEETADTWEEITWFTSSNDGASWSGPTRVSRAGSETEAFNAEKPTAVWLESGRIWISWMQEKPAAPGTYYLAIRERSI